MRKTMPNTKTFADHAPCITPAPALWHAACRVLCIALCLGLVACAVPGGRSPKPEAEQLPPQPAILFAGDSIMQGLGPVLADGLARHSGWRFVQAGLKSTGLCRPDYYDWPAKLREYLAVERPKLVVLCLGTNDDQNVRHDGRSIAFDSPRWEAAYTARVEEINAIISQGGAQAIWMSAPIMGKARLRGRVERIMKVIRASCEASGVTFVNVWHTLADGKGRYRRHLQQADGRRVALRARDGVHVTRAGNGLLARAVLPVIEARLPLLH